MKLFKNRSFKPGEMCMVKVCLISLGILLGLYFFDFLANLLIVWWVLFVGPAIYFVIRFMQGK